MVANFSKPVATDPKLDVLEVIRDNNVVLSSWDYGGVPSSTIPAGAKRWNENNRRFEEFNGSSWIQLADEYNINVNSFSGRPAAYYTSAQNLTGTISTDRLPEYLRKVSPPGSSPVHKTVLLDDPDPDYFEFNTLRGFQAVGAPFFYRDHTWEALAQVPNNAIAILVQVRHSVYGSFNHSFSEMNARRYESTAAMNLISRLDGTERRYHASQLMLPIKMKTFEAHYRSSAITSIEARIYLIGWCL